MENKDTPAFAINDTTWAKMGLTKLEYFTGIALQAVLMDEGRFWADTSDEKIAQTAISLATEVLKQLENK